MGAFPFWAHRRGIRTRQGAELRKRKTFSSAAREERSGARAAKWTLGENPCAKNAKYEYCYYFSNSGFETSEGKTGTKATIDHANQHSIWP